MSLPHLSPKETATVIRKMLKAQFPATKFQVTTGRGAGVSSVSIRWTDGPTVRRVDALVGGFEPGHFDGMTDSYEFDRSRFLLVDGVAYVPGTRYVNTSRTVSAALANRCIAQLVEFWGGIDNAPVAEPEKYSAGYRIVDGRGHERVRADLSEDWYTLIHRAAGDRTRFLREPRALTAREG
jgi:hypothetical protein